MKKVTVVFLALMFLLVGCEIDTTEPTDAKPVATETETTPDWRKDFPADLVAEIEAAFTEIGENPNNIVSVEYVDTHTSGSVFERKCYNVEFSYSFLNPGWKHAQNYRISTQNYFDGEPEKEQYPDEFLITIKFWVGDDGHDTNINQWSWTGDGNLQ